MSGTKGGRIPSFTALPTSAIFPPMPDPTLTLRVTLIAPPAGVWFSLQEGDATPVQQVICTGADLTFDIPVRVAEGPKGLRFLGPYVRAEGQRRFVYYRSGRLAGQHDTPWTRRGKVFLTDIPEALVREAAASGRPLAASFPGTAKDGGPSCATVRPLDGWSPG
jgi:hypothetical protein